MRASQRTRLLSPLHLVVIALCCAPFAACLGLDVGPGLTYDQDIVVQGQALPELARAQGHTAAIAVSGQIVGKLPCDQIEIKVEEHGNDLKVIVTLDANRNSCNGVAPTTWSYVANILNIEAGLKNVRVEHRFRGVDGVAGVRLDTAVTVS